MKSLIVFSMLLFPLWSKAHQVSFGYSSDSKYNSFSIGTYWEVADQWNAYFDLLSSGEVGDRSKNSDRYRDLALGFDYKINNYFSFGLGLQKTEETDEINSKGAGLEGSYLISHLWDGKKETMLTFSFRNLKYEQSDSATKIAQLNSNFNQKITNISMIQEIIDWLDIELGVTNYSYSEELLTVIVNYNNRTSYNSFINTLVYGFPESSTYLTLSFYLSEKWGVDFTGGSTITILDENKTTTTSLDLKYKPEKRYGIKLGLSKSKSDTLENTMLSLKFILNF